MWTVRIRTHVAVLFVVWYACIFVNSSGAEQCNTTQSRVETKLHTEKFKYLPDLTYRVIIPARNSCDIDLDTLFNQTLSLWEGPINTSALFMEFKFYCIHAITLRFNSTGIVEAAQNINIFILFKTCSIRLHDLFLFSRIGSIFSLKQMDEKSAIITGQDPICPFAAEVQIMECYLDIGTDDNVQTRGHFFWELCTESFDRLFRLVLIGRKHKTNYWKHSNIRQRFPNIKSLVLQYLELQTPLVFQWEPGQTDGAEKCNTLNDLSKVEGPKVYIPFASFANRYSYDLNIITLQGEFIIIDLQNVTKSTNDIAGSMFEKVHGTVELYIRENKLETFNSSIFKNMTCLQSLVLEENTLKYLHDSTFKGLDLVIKLSLAKNQLTSLSSKLFEPLVSLQELQLQGNDIAHLPKDIFSNLLQLVKLDMSENPLVDLPVWPIYMPLIYLIDLHKTNISDFSFSSLTIDDLGTLSDAPLSVPGDLNPGDSKFKRIDLSDCNISNFQIGNYSKISKSIFQFIFTTFDMNMEGNQFSCFCEIERLRSYLETMLQIGFVCNWKCQQPHELAQRGIVTLGVDELYCNMDISNCPAKCTCSQRLHRQSWIVDCSHTNLTYLPDRMPDVEAFELWIKNSSLREFNFRAYLLRIIGIDLSHNTIDYLEPIAVSQLMNATYIYINSNHLTSIPIQVTSLDMSKLSLTSNPFICDCNTKWMKPWILGKEDVISDWTKLECTDTTNKLKQFIAVPDDMFVCKDSRLSVSEHILLPSIVVGSILFVLVSISLLVYFQRFNLKILLYIKCGIDPFNKTQDDETVWKYDAFIVFDRMDELFVQTHIASHLLERNYKLALFRKDFIIGYSEFENIDEIIKVSRRVIFCLSKDALATTITRMAWTIAYERATDVSMKSIILIADSNLQEQCREDSILKFLRNNRFIKRKSNLIKESVLYLMPRHSAVGNVQMDHMIMPRNSGLDEAENDAILVLTSYPDNVHYYVRNEFMPLLKEHNFHLSDIDMEFTPGADIRDDIFEVLNRAEYFIYIMSNETLRNEVKLFILSEAITKSMMCNHNYLLLVIQGDIDMDVLTTDIKNYINNFVTAKLNKEYFKEHILQALSYKMEKGDNEDNDRDINIDPLL